ncbi:hypothetical protein NC595_14035 [Dyella sp. Sa]|uniref:Uncharacterized protein n=2 Tax=Dyella lutea TaxID=2950441 RepID=A0ABT1FCQ4_9GAMM|nr:hypothetical protein [Dyella lutea]
MEGRVLLYIEGEITLAELVDPANDAPH